MESDCQSEDLRAMGLRREARKLRAAIATLESQAKEFERKAEDLEHTADRKRLGCGCPTNRTTEARSR